MMNGYDMAGWGWLAMLLIVVGPLLALGFVIWLLGPRRSSEARGQTSIGREALDARLASGAIGIYEYRQLRAELDGPPAQSEGRRADAPNQIE